MFTLKICDVKIFQMNKYIPRPPATITLPLMTPIAASPRTVGMVVESVHSSEIVMVDF
jgi:hypothetical protein